MSIAITSQHYITRQSINFDRTYFRHASNIFIYIVLAYESGLFVNRFDVQSDLD